MLVTPSRLFRLSRAASSRSSLLPFDGAQGRAADCPRLLRNLRPPPQTAVLLSWGSSLAFLARSLAWPRLLVHSLDFARDRSAVQERRSTSKLRFAIPAVVQRWRTQS